jgi:hypothetical protein
MMFVPCCMQVFEMDQKRSQKRLPQSLRVPCVTRHYVKNNGNREGYIEKKRTINFQFGKKPLTAWTTTLLTVPLPCSLLTS